MIGKMELNMLLILLLVSAISVSNGKEQKPNCGRSTNFGILYTNRLQMITRVDQKRLNITDYKNLRHLVDKCEEYSALGADIRLTVNETAANNIIMKMKLKEIDEGFINPSQFSPSKHLFSQLEKIQSSPLFQLLTKMPKGGILHAHDTALASTDYLIQLTYRENLWACTAANNTKFKRFLFSTEKPKSVKSCEWDEMETLRSKMPELNQTLAAHFSLFPKEHYVDNNAVWRHFMGIFILLDGLLTYYPVWGDYYYQALEEMYADGVQYLEFRSVLPELYHLNGTKSSKMDTVKLYKENLDKFMATHDHFIGSRLIYAPLRSATQEEMAQYIKDCEEIKKAYPDFLAGFDLVGQEELGRPLREFIPQLLNVSDDIDFFFHAGETNWYGTSVDENLIDAVLLGAKRIGHGFAINKHPFVLDMLKKRQIAIEVNPISNQVLQLIGDFRNHPAVSLIARNYPMVVSSDDPSFWRATPLSHDFYITFLGIASANDDLRLLKKLALNSIRYSSMTYEQKQAAYQKWSVKWRQFIQDINRNHNSTSETSLL